MSVIAIVNFHLTFIELELVSYRTKKVIKYAVVKCTTTVKTITIALNDNDYKYNFSWHSFSVKEVILLKIVSEKEVIDY